MFIVDMASRYPVSGNEVSEQVSSISGGLWRPSPGSVYYILSELVSKGEISEIYTPDRVVKKYVATEKGLSKLSLFESFGRELVARQLTFLQLTSSILNDRSMAEILNECVSKLKVSALKP